MGLVLGILREDGALPLQGIRLQAVPRDGILYQGRMTVKEVRAWLSIIGGEQGAVCALWLLRSRGNDERRWHMCDENAFTTTNEIVPSFVESFDEDVLDVAIELGELGLDAVVDVGVFADVPVIRTVIGLGKTVRNLYERNFARQVVSFLVGVRSGAVDSPKFAQHRERLRSDPHFAEKELGYVLILVDKNVDERRSKLQGKLYGALAMGRIGWDEFVDACEVLSRCMMSDLETLRLIHVGELRESTAANTFRTDRLASLGLIARSVKSMVEVGAGTDMRYYLSTTAFGQMLCEYALDGEG